VERLGLNREAIRTLGLIVLASVVGIILLALWGLALRFGVLGDGATEASAGNTVADEALSILGNVAAAAVGGLVGWLARDLTVGLQTPQEPPGDKINFSEGDSGGPE